MLEMAELLRYQEVDQYYALLEEEKELVRLAGTVVPVVLVVEVVLAMELIILAVQMEETGKVEHRQMNT